MPRDEGSRGQGAGKSAFDRLRHTHRRIEERVEELESAARALGTKDVGSKDVGTEEGADPREVCEHVLGFFERAVARHEQDEEESLFPRVVHVPDLEVLVRKLALEHETQRALTVRVAEALDARTLPASFASTVAELVASYRRHIHEEEHELFPRAEAVLDGPTMERIAIEMESRRGR